MKPLIDPALISAGAQMRAPKALGPGIARIGNVSQDGIAEVMLYGEIGSFWGDGVEAPDFIKALGDIEAQIIDVRMNSPGGSVFDGIAIYNALVQHPAQVVMHIEGLAASIASVIAMAGDEIRIGESANMMIHPPWTISMGGAADFRKQADVLDKLEEGIVAVYAARSGKDASEIQPKVASETWFRGQEAVDFGLATHVTPNKGSKKAKNAVRQPILDLFHNTPADLVAENGDEPAIRQLEQLLRDEEGCSATHAKRLAGLANRVLGPQRDVAALGHAPRDEDDDRDASVQALSLANHIRSLIL